MSTICLYFGLLNCIPSRSLQNTGCHHNVVTLSDLSLWYSQIRFCFSIVIFKNKKCLHLFGCWLPGSGLFRWWQRDKEELGRDKVGKKEFSAGKGWEQGPERGKRSFVKLLTSQVGLQLKLCYIPCWERPTNVFSKISVTLPSLVGHVPLELKELSCVDSWEKSQFPFSEGHLIYYDLGLDAPAVSWS